MHQLPHQSYEAWRVCMSGLHILAILSSCFRITARYRTRRMWWDDYLVLIPTGVDVFFMVTLWLFPPITPESISNSDVAFGKTWTGAFPSYTTVWMSRICFMVSLARIFPPGHTYRRSSLAFALFFTALYVVAMLIVSLRCKAPATAKPNPTHCIKTGKADVTWVFGFATEMLGAFILVSYPLSMLNKFTLPIFETRMLLVALLSSASTLILVIVLAILSYGPFTKDLSYTVVMYMLTHMAGALALIACNMLVFMSAIIRKIRNRRKNNITLQSWLRQANPRDVPFVMGLQDPNPWPELSANQPAGVSHQTTSLAPYNLTVPSMSSYTEETIYTESGSSQAKSGEYGDIQVLSTSMS